MNLNKISMKKDSWLLIDKVWTEQVELQLTPLPEFAKQMGVGELWLRNVLTVVGPKRTPPAPALELHGQYYFSDSDREAWRAAIRDAGMYPKIRDGYVYFMEAENGLIKIGWSEQPHKRLANLVRLTPLTLSLLAAVPGSTQDERSLHEHFASLRQQGEWFRSSPELRSVIAEAQRQDTIRKPSGDSSNVVTLRAA